MIDETQLCIDVLNQALSDVEVSSELPPEHPRGSYVQVSRTGGDENEWLTMPIMTLICWGKSDVQAKALATDCVHAMAEQAKIDPLLSDSRLITMGRDEWTATGQSRYMVQLKLTINK